MFCGNCGTNVPDGTEFCPNCGNALAEAQTPAAPAQNTFTASAAIDQVKGMDKKKLTIIGAAAAAVVALIIIIAIIASSVANAPVKAAKKYVKAIYTSDAKTMVSFFTDEELDDLMEEYDVSSKKELIDELKEDLEDRQLDDFKIKSAKEKHLSENSKKDYMEQIADNYEDTYDKEIKVKDVVKVEVDYEYDNDGDTESDDTTVYMYKANGNWYPVYLPTLY